MIYFIQVTIYTALLYMVYVLFLKNKADHNWSRTYLLMNMVMPFALPFITLPAIQRNSGTVSEVMLPVIQIGAEVSESTSNINILPLIYIGICSVLVGYLIAQAVQIALFIKKHSYEKQGNIRLIRDTGMGPGSWFNYVFIPGDDAESEVLEHEAAHVRYKHSYDIVLMRLLQCFAWPNVLVWMIGKELRAVHEFQADAVAGGNKAQYETTLLNELFQTKHFSLSHTFFHHPIKRRIMMLQKNETRAGKMKVVALSVILVSGVLFAQAAKDDTKPTVAKTQQKMDAAGVYSQVDKMPKFLGDDPRYLSNFVLENLAYPQAAKDKKIEGDVIVRFIIDEDGNVQDAHVTSSPDAILTDAVMAVMNKMPKWIPGENNGRKVKVYYTLPISYKMEYPKAQPFKETRDVYGNQVKTGLGIMTQPARDNTVRIFAGGGC
jgi:TonB family protein